MIYKVWDQLNGEEDCARAIVADCPEEAAIIFAEEDIDGNIDGIYTNRDGSPRVNLQKTGQPIKVRDTKTEELHLLRVGITEYTPIFTAEIDEP